jgi:hypothetical protein
MKITEHNSKILDPEPVEMGFIVGKYEDPLMYAAVPSGTQLAILHKGETIKVCRNRQSAINFISKHQKQNKRKK